MKNTLVLPIKKHWFDLIKSGEKTEEYREINDYWKKRLGFMDGYYKSHKFVEFRNGYGLSVPKFKIELKYITIGTPKASWGGGIINSEGKLKECFILKLGGII